MFFKGSRYQLVATETLTDAGGRPIRYKGQRLVPPTPARAVHEVLEGERLDHIAHAWYRDAERFWRICDANHALWPDDLVAQPGRTILVPPSE
jgi:hypothetical protein